MKTYAVRVDIVVTDPDRQVSEVEVVQVVYTCDNLKGGASVCGGGGRPGESEVVDGGRAQWDCSRQKQWRIR